MRLLQVSPISIQAFPFAPRFYLTRRVVRQNLHHWFGNGDIGGDPKYVNQESGNLRLGSDSACIDRCANLVDWDPFEPGFQTLPEGDLDGMPRVVDGDSDGLAIVDMGAFEYQGEQRGLTFIRLWKRKVNAFSLGSRQS